MRKLSFNYFNYFLYSHYYIIIFLIPNSNFIKKYTWTYFVYNYTYLFIFLYDIKLFTG